MLKTIALTGFAVFLASCETPYRERSDWSYSGYEEVQVNSDTWTIKVMGGSYSSLEKTRGIALLRASEIAIRAGRKGFKVIGGEGIGYQMRDDIGMKVMRGSIQVRLIDVIPSNDADSYDAQATAARLRAQIAG